MPASSKISARSGSAPRRSPEPLIRDFFADYAKRMNDGLANPRTIDSKAMRDAFADHFLGADPNGVRTARNGLLFRLMLTRGIKYYRKIGTLAMDVTGIEVTELDAVHVMARVVWLACYKSGKEIAFTNIYLLQDRDGVPKIFAWITGDEQQALMDAGVID